MNESSCKVESLQRQVFELDTQIADCERSISLAQAGEGLVFKTPLFNPSAGRAGLKVLADRLKQEKLLVQLRKQRARLVKEFAKQKQSCRWCSRGCLMGL